MLQKFIGDRSFYRRVAGVAVPIVPLFILCSCMKLIKCVIGFFIIRSDSWSRNLTSL